MPPNVLKQRQPQTRRRINAPCSLCLGDGETEQHGGTAVASLSSLTECAKAR